MTSFNAKTCIFSSTIQKFGIATLTYLLKLEAQFQYEQHIILPSQQDFCFLCNIKKSITHIHIHIHIHIQIWNLYFLWEDNTPAERRVSFRNPIQKLSNKTKKHWYLYSKSMYKTQNQSSSQLWTSIATTDKHLCQFGRHKAIRYLKRHCHMFSFFWLFLLNTRYKVQTKILYQLVNIKMSLMETLKDL